MPKGGFGSLTWRANNTVTLALLVTSLTLSGRINIRDVIYVRLDIVY